AETVAFHGLGEDHRRRAFVLDRDLVRRVDLLRIVPAARQLLKLLIRHVLDKPEQLGVLAKEMLADVGAALDAVALILAVDGFGHALDEEAVFVLGEKRVPIAAPDDFDHVPAGAAEGGFQLLNDLAVTADGTVEALEVAVDDEDEVVEPLAR